VVAIVGRPNVGKSTFFNRVIGSRLAVVHDEPGITRDRLVRRAEWNGVLFELVDTGGWVPEARDHLDAAILSQVLQAMEACDLVIFVTDARAGLQPHDREIAQALFRQRVRVILAVNKVDAADVEADAAEFQELGLEEVFSIAAESGRGVGDLLDGVVRALPPRGSSEEDPNVIRTAVVGRPNVGKSSIVNRLLRQERMIVDSVAGTTRDAVDSPLRYHGRPLVLVDTAGLRRKLDSQPSWEFYATLRALRALDRSDVAVLVLDGSGPINRQDARIGDMILQAGVACVIAVNKWDLVVKDNTTAGAFVERIRESMPFLTHAPVELVSALTAQRISRLPEAVVRVHDEARREVPTSQWNEILKKAVERVPPVSYRSQRPVRIYYATQVRTAPPTVAIFVSDPRRVAPDYVRYLTGRFREALGFEGNPIRLVLRKS